MLSINKKISVAILSLIVLFAAAMPADAQWRRYRDRGTSKKEKAAWIGGGAAAGAVIGGMLNGSKGAVLGGLLGAGAGTGVAIIRDRNERNDNEWRGRYRYNRYNRVYGQNYRFRR